MNEKDMAVEPMHLRADPPRVTRLSRKMLTGIGFVASLGIGGALIYALHDADPVKQGEELYPTSNRPPADGLARLPRDYAGPVLGPPLPGDLGRPILDAQNRGQAVVPPSIASPAIDEPDAFFALFAHRHELNSVAIRLGIEREGGQLDTQSTS